MRNTIIHYLACIILLFIAQAVPAQRQSFSVIPFDTSDGMASPVSFGIKKDKLGFIWVSTRQGIDRFDGLQFKHYSLTENDMRMADDGVRHDLLENGDGYLYAFSDLGKVFRYDENIDNFVLIHHLKHFLGGHSLHALAIEPEYLILGLFNGICIIDRQTLSIKSTQCQGTNIRCIIPFANKTYLAGSEHGLWVLDLTRNTCELIASPELDIMSLYYDAEQQRVWMGTKGNGLWTLRLDKPKYALQISNFEHAVVTSICTYSDSQLLIGTDGGGLLRTSRQFISSLDLLAGTSPDAPNTLPSAAVQNVFEDNNNIWLATYDCGMILLAPKPMVGVFSLPEIKYSSDKYCYDIDCSEAGDVWAAFNRYICHYTDEQTTADIYLEGSSGFLAVEALSDGTVCAGGYNSGLYRFDPKTRKTQHIASLSGANVNSSIYDFLEDSDGNLWIGGHNFPLTCIKHILHRPVEYMPKQSEMVQYDITRIGDIAQLNDSTIVVGAVDGIYIINSNTGKITHLLTGSDDFNWSGTNFVSCVETQDGHIVYIGTDGAGLLTYDIQTNNFSSFTASSHQLPSNYIRGIEISGDSMVWVSTENKGIFSFDIKSQTVKHRFSSSSLQSAEFMMHASKTLPNGNIVFGGKGGIETIYTSEIADAKPTLDIFLSEISIGQESRISYISRPDILDKKLTEATHIRLPYGEKSLRLKFTTNDIYHQSDLLMLFKLGEASSAWLPMNSQRELNYYTLPVGKHHIWIRCVSSNGQYIEKAFIIEALQAPWLSWYAVFCYALLLSVIIYFIVLFYKKHIENNAAEEKIKFFNSVAHDIKTPLSLVSAPLSDLEQYVSPNVPENLLPLLKQNLQHLSNIVNQLLLFNSSQNGIQQLDMKPTPLCELAKNMALAYQPLAKNRNLTLEANIPENEIWILADINALTRICDNILGNAFKFTKAGKITITVRSRGHNGQLEVRDTGIGMDDNTRKKLFLHFFRGENALKEKVSGFGLGMVYSNQAIKKMNGRITCQSHEGKGSTFTINLPLTRPGKYTAEDSMCELQVAGSTELDQKILYSGYRQNILLVEDNAEMLKYLTSKLSLGYNVYSVTNVEEAKDYLKKKSTDLIISDVMMPGMRGDEWCKELKNNFETSHIPVILLTAMSNSEDQIQSLSIGADDYITKPFNLNILLIKIRNIFDSKRKLRTYYMQTMDDFRTKEKTNGNRPSAKESPCTQREIDDQFIAQLMSVVDKYISQPNLSADDIAREMAMSHTLFYEKINKLLGVPPATFLRNCRMKHAKELLLQKEHSVAEVAMMCGYADPKHFSTSFKKFYGCSPSKIN